MSSLTFADDMARLQRALAQCHDMVARRTAGLEALRLRTRERVLEVGCGGGVYAYEAAQSVGPTGRVCALDLSAEGTDDPPVRDRELLGSANLVTSDLPLRREMPPWLAQLFVEPGRRRDGVGAALVHAVLQRARQCSYTRVYLYTSGTLPHYYSRLGWRLVERLEYLGRERTVMAYEIEARAL